MVKQFPSLAVDFLNKNITCCLIESAFLNDFKSEVVYLTHKKDSKAEKSNLRQINILAWNLSKIYEILLFDQMYTYFDNFSPKHQCNFWKGYKCATLPFSYDRENERSFW